MEDRKNLRSTIEAKLVQTGEKERLKELLRLKLVESGWRDNLKTHCRDVIKTKGGEQITVEELVKEITPQAKAMVPEEVKRELLARIRKFLVENTDL